LAALQTAPFRAMSTQAQWLALHFSISRRVGHLARFVPPDAMRDAEATARTCVGEFVGSLFSVALPLAEPIAGLIDLPIHDGGLGLRCFALEPAFIAGTLAGRAELLERLGAPIGPPRRLTSSSGPPTLGAGDLSLRTALDEAIILAHPVGLALHAARAALETLDAVIATAAGSAAATELQGESKSRHTRARLASVLPALGALPRAHLQAALSRFLHEYALLRWRQMAKASDDPWRDVSREGCSGPGAGAWLVAFPGAVPQYQPSLTWRGDAFRTAVQIRLGVRLSHLIAAGMPEAGTTCFMQPLAAADAAAASHVSDEEDVPEDPDHQPDSPQARTDTTTCSSSARAHCDRLGRHLFTCKFGGFDISTHNAVARALVHCAPRVPGVGGPNGGKIPSAKPGVIQKALLALAPGRSRWHKPDVLIPAGAGSRGGLDTFVDVRLVYAATEARCRGLGRREGRGSTATAASIVAKVLRRSENEKIHHYASTGVTTAGGPCAAGVGRSVPFVMEQGGRFAPEAMRLLRLLAQARAGEDPGGGRLTPRSTVHLRSATRLLSTRLQQMRAYRVHQAAEWLSASRGSAFSAGLALSSAPREPETYPAVDPEFIDLDPLGLRAAAAAWA
jgi:hypothetical protein